jgi:subtilase family serine protease
VVTGESAWSGSGGGVSQYEALPSYQTSVNSSARRGIPDVSYDADPNTGFAVRMLTKLD